MNYTRIYTSIVLRAQSERTERLALKKQGKYFEDHHIVPRSLGGRDVIQNMALLTGREHFICHWLLVKIYPLNSDERAKMLYALWRMSSKKPSLSRYVNSHVYEYYRAEFSKQVSQLLATIQTGENNSQYGTHWYTNCYTGETKRSRTQLTYPWYQGRNLFRGEQSALKFKHTYNAIQANDKIVHRYHNNEYQQSLRKAQQLWDSFHQSNCRSITEFTSQCHLKHPAIYRWFNNYIPKFSEMRSTRRHQFKPDTQLIGVYV